MKQCVLRSHAGIIEAGSDRRGIAHLAVLILQEMGLIPVEDPDVPRCDACSMQPCLHSLARSLHPDHDDVRIILEGVKEPHGIAPSAHTGDE